jgi:hypothetical protein
MTTDKAIITGKARMPEVLRGVVDRNRLQSTQIDFGRHKSTSVDKNRINPKTHGKI